MKVLQKDIEKISENLAKHFMADDGQKQLNTFCGIEETHRKDYKGREILELLQNAIDALDSSKSNNEILIRLSGDVFYIYNTGEPFELAGLESLAYAHNSTKKSSKFIGNKGLGFRSILNWADNIQIFSKNGLRVEYDAESSNAFYREKLRNLPNYDAIFEKNVDDLIFPILSYPKYVTKDFDFKKYVTCVRLHIKSSATKSVKRQLESLDTSTLLFLPDISRLIIDDNGDKRTYSKRILKNTAAFDEVELSSDSDSKKLFVYKKGGKFGKEKWQIRIAMDNEMDKKNNYLYNYFRTKIRFPIGWHVHATFELNSERNDIESGNEKNEFLLKTLLDFLLETSEKIAKERRDFTVAETLIRSYSFDNSLDVEEESFDELFARRLCELHILPTLSNEMLCLKDYPCAITEAELYEIIEEYQPRLRKHVIFDRLLKIGIPEKWEEYGNDMYIREPDQKKLYDYINRIRNFEPLKSDLIKRAEIALLLYREYGDSYSSVRLPSLFVTDSQVAIAQDIYIGNKEEIVAVPDFVKFKFMNSAQLEYILSKVNSYDFGWISSVAELAKSNLGSFFKLKTVDVHSILENASERVERQKNQKKLVQYFEKYLDFIKYNKSDFNENDKILLVSRDNKLKPAKCLYFGSDYDEDLCENLLCHKKELFIKSADYYNKTAAELKSILSGIVASSPRLVQERSSNYYSEMFYKWTCKELDLVKKAEPQYFFRWFLDVFSNVDASEIKMGKRGNRTYDENYSELYRDIKQSKVFKTEKDSYDFEHILEHGDKIGENVNGIFGVELVDYFAKLGIDGTENKVKNIVKLFNITDSYTKLDAEKFYKIMDALPEFDKSGKTSSSIYYNVTRDDVLEKKIKKYDLADYYRKNIKLFTNHGYVKSKNVVYAPYKEPDCFNRVANFIKLSGHVNQERVKTIFGINIFDHSKVEIRNNPKPNLKIASELKKDIDDLKTYILALRLSFLQNDKNKQLDERRIRRLEIIPTTKILASYNNQKAESLDEYNFIQDQNKNRFYIVLHDDKTFKDVTENPDYCKSILDIVSIAMDSDEEMGIIKDMAKFSPEYREKIYLDAEKDYDLLKEACSKLGKALESEENSADVVVDSFYMENLELLRHAQEEYEGKYFTAIYNRVKNEEIPVNNFCDELEKYKQFDFSSDLSEEDSELIGLEKIDQTIARDILKKNFPMLDYNVENLQKRIIDSAKNRRMRLNNEYENTDDRAILDEILSQNESLLYFENEYDTIKTMADKKIELKRRENNSVAKSFNDYERPEATLTYIKNTVASTPFEERHKKVFRHVNATTLGYKKRAESNIAKGGVAEYEVRRKLELAEGYSDIKWHSSYSTNKEYAREFLEASSNDSIGYDISFVDKNQKVHYVEVKACDFNEHCAAFTMSSNELDFASKHPDQYDLYLVKVKDNNQPADIRALEAFYKEDFDKSADNYTIRITY